MPPNHYDTLGVTTTATDADIKEAYKVMAMKWHPDRNLDDVENATAKFQDVQEAFAVLSDKSQRRQYDAIRGFGKHSEKAHQTREAFKDKMRSAYGGAFGGVGPEFYGGYGDTEDLRQAFQDKFKGEDGTAKGHVTSLSTLVDQKQAIGGGPNGTVEVTIPAGIPNGTVLRLKGQGQPTDYKDLGKDGDLYVTIIVTEENWYKRDGADLTQEIKVPFTDMLFGTSIDVRLLGGTAQLKIPPGSQPGNHMKLTGQGFPRFRKEGRGDMYVTLQVSLPKPEDLSSKQEKVLRKMAMKEKDETVSNAV